MPLIRLLLLLLILGSLAIFALQNWSPVLPLVVLGGQTFAAPLAVWVLGAGAAGALTSVILSGLTATPSARRSTRVADRSPKNNGRWTGGWSAPDSDLPRSQTSSRSDDWNDRPAQSDWEDWAAPPPPDRSNSGSSTRIQDTQDEDWDNWDGYDERQNDPVDRPPQTYETAQEPIPQQQTGSVYSYTYSKPETKETVYDAEYRVITPPYRSDAEDDRFADEPYRPEADRADEPYRPEADRADEPTPTPAQSNDDDDWDFIDDDWDTDRDRR